MKRLTFIKNQMVLKSHLIEYLLLPLQYNRRTIYFVVNYVKLHCSVKYFM